MKLGLNKNIAGGSYLTPEFRILSTRTRTIICSSPTYITDSEGEDDIILGADDESIVIG